MKEFKLVFILAFAALLVLLSTNDSFAAIGPRPGAFHYEVEPSAQTEDTVLVRNTGDNDRYAVVYASDGVESSSGGFAARQRSEPKVGVGAWIRFYPDPIPEQFENEFNNQGKSIVRFCKLNVPGSQQWCQGKEEVELDLKAGARIEIPFTFSVPKNAQPGEYTGGLFVQGMEKNNADAGMRLTTRSGARIYQTIKGEEDPCLPPGPPWPPGEPNPPGPPCNPGNEGNPPGEPEPPGPPSKPGNGETPPGQDKKDTQTTHDVNTISVDEDTKVTQEEKDEKTNQEKDTKPVFPFTKSNYESLSHLPANIRFQIMMSQHYKYSLYFGTDHNLNGCIDSFDLVRTETINSLMICLKNTNT